MTEYALSDLIRLARRHHNTKRNYLLVNPLQGKHLPVPPSRALAMLQALGERMAASAPDVDLVVGFAETATAVAAMAAAGMGRNCRYIHTTRERFPGGEDVAFREEHSHAVDQRLCLTRLRGWIGEASAVAFVDDELTTGRTLSNAVDTLRASCPSLSEKPMIAASLIGRLTDAHRDALKKRGIRCLSLVELPPEDYTAAVRRFPIDGARPPQGGACAVDTIALPPTTGDPREGVVVAEWLAQLRDASAALAEALRPRLSGMRVTVLGTEEYMLPALLLGYRLETEGIAQVVRCHATTRSPIGICPSEDYPIHRGWRLRSFYEAERTTYIYNLEPCDAAVVLTDSPDDAAAGMAASDLAAALAEAGCPRMTLIREARHVQHL